MIRLFAPLTTERQTEVVESLGHNAIISRDFVLLIVLSCVIASFGLVLNSAAVIIGAMLISPLMSPIIGLALALLRGDLGGAGRALGSLLLGIALAIALSAALGQLVSMSGVVFAEELPTEILGRTRPTVFDLVVALAGGAAAAYALAQPGLSATLPGVAIATALMPPLCVVGLGLALGRSDVSSGALLLFVANFVAITFAGSVIFAAVGFRPEATRGPRRALHVTRVLPIALLLLVTVPLVLLTQHIIREAQENQTIRDVLVTQLSRVSDSALVGFEKAWSGEHLDVVASVRAPRSLTYEDALAVQRELAARLDAPVALKLLVIPLTRLDPLFPPTRTPTAVVGGAIVPPTATASATVQLSPTLLRPTATAVPSPTLAPTPSPTVTPIAYAVIGGTQGRGANLRREAGRAAIVATLRDGTVVQLQEGRAAADGLSWVEVVAPDGRVGWITADYLIPYERYIAPGQLGAR